MKMFEKFRWRLANYLIRGIVLNELRAKKIVDVGGPDGTGYMDKVKFTAKTSDPTLSAGLMWFRSDLTRVRYSGDGATVISLDPAKTLTEDTKGYTLDSASYDYASYSNLDDLYIKYLSSGGDFDWISDTRSYASTSLAFAGFSSQNYSESTTAIKVRLFMGGVQQAESGYLGLFWTLVALQSTKALSGSQTCKIQAHNYDSVSRGFWWKRAGTDYAIVSLQIASIKQV